MNPPPPLISIPSSSSSSSNSVESTSSELNNEKLTQMESKLDQCVLQDDLMNLQRMVEDKTREFHGAMTLLNDQVKTMDEEMDESKRYVIIFRGIFIVTQN